MSSDPAVTHWLQLLKAGDHAAAQPLWELYFDRLVALARKKLHGAPRRSADEEDVALNALNSLCRGAAQGRFPHLNKRDDLRRLLFQLTAEKAARQVRYEMRAKRGSGKVQSEADLPHAEERDEGALVREMSKEPTPEIAAQMVDECRHLLKKLGDGDLRSIAELKMEGCTDEEIATKLSITSRTVRRKLAVIRGRWEKEGRSS
jgi:DNA-directed RNA polymerase specialized sigma24 family protein